MISFKNNSSLKFKFLNLSLDTGVKLHYLEQGEIHGESVIFLHGYADSLWSFKNVFSILPKYLHVYAIDQRGHGNSEKPICEYTLSEFAEDVSAFINHQNIKNVTIVGHSLDGCVALKTAHLYPILVKRLVLINSGLNVCENPRIPILLNSLKLMKTITHEFVYDFLTSDLVTDIPKDFLELCISESLKVPIRVWRQILISLLKENLLNKESKHIKQPTLII